MSRGVVLTASRLSNFAILVFSPLLLVRILDVAAFGRYQEFMVYAALFIIICGFGIDASLTYFLPRYPNDERKFLSQSSALVLIFSFACLAIVVVAKQLLLEIASYDFVLPLAAYVFFFVNLNWLEYYWIAKKRTDLVFYYSAGRLAVRVTVLLAVAYITRDVGAILWSLVGVEAFRALLVVAFLLRANLLTLDIDWKSIKQQVQFATPVGIAGLMQVASQSIGKLFVGGVLGPVALAYYAVASYLLPMVNVIQGSSADVVFPELVKVSHDPDGALRLWQRSVVVYCVILFPSFVLLTYYAELFVTTLFTDEYLAAVPVFQVYALWLLRRCSNLDTLLRTRGKAGFMVKGTGMSVVLNVALMPVFYWWLGLIGPAIAYIAAESLLEIYYAILVKREYGRNVADLVDWGEVSRVGAGCLAGIPLLVAIDHLPGPELAKAAVASLTFVTASWLVAYRLGVSDIGRVLGFALSLVRRSK